MYALRSDQKIKPAPELLMLIGKGFKHFHKIELHGL
jgi:hypothetical protein